MKTGKGTEIIKINLLMNKSKVIKYFNDYKENFYQEFCFWKIIIFSKIVVFLFFKKLLFNFSLRIIKISKLFLEFKII